MKHKIKSLLILSGLSTLFLTACNSGTSTPQTQTTPPMESAPPTEGEDVISSVLQFVGTQIASHAVSDYMKANGITVGDLALNTQAYPILNSLYQATGNSTNEILAGLASLSSQLQQDTLLLQIQQQQDYQSLMAMQLNIANQQSQLTVDTLMNNVNDSYTGVVSWLNQIDQNESNNLPTMTNIFQGLVAESAFSANQVNTMLKKIKTFPFNSTNTEANNNLENGGFALGMDSVNVVYNWTQPIPSTTQAQNYQSSFFNQQLQLQESAYTLANQFKSTDSFAAYKQWSDSLDLMYAQTLNTLLQIGAIDQVRVYLYANTPYNSSTMPSIPAYIPTSHLSSLADMESDVAYAMQYRIQNLTMAIQQSKDQMFNYYFGTIVSTTMTSQCNLTESAFLTVTESQVNTQLGTWNGNILTTNCKKNDATIMQTSSNIGELCTTTTGQNPIAPRNGQSYTYQNMDAQSNNYNLYAWNGNISCGVQNWAKTIFTGFQPNYAANTLNPVNFSPYTGNFWIDGVITWANYLPIASPIYNYNTSYSAMQLWHADKNDNSSLGYYINNSFTTTNGKIASSMPDQSFIFTGTLVNGNYLNASSSSGALIFDGAHAYMMIGYWNSNGSSNIGIQCLPSDSNCSTISGNGSYSLSFTNGDTITISNYGYIVDGSLGWFWITPQYSATPASYPQ